MNGIVTYKSKTGFTKQYKRIKVVIKCNEKLGEECMKVTYFDFLSEDVKKIRQAVFMDEQGFQNEFDDTDEIATHIVMYDQDGAPIATCRVFAGEEKDSYILGRLAVIKQYRGKHLGAKMVDEAEKIVIAKSGKNLCLHAQCRVEDFYAKAGFVAYGQADEEEGCPHIWMKKQLCE